jgi:TonB family protein
MGRVFASILLLVVAASLGCAARRSVVAAPPEPEVASPPPITIAPYPPLDGALTIAPYPPPDGALPKFGDYVYVEELPEAITKVAPEYPTTCREQGVEGTVMVQALVGKDGRVKDTRIIKSIPMLDAAAVAAVRQWVFKPALAHNQPVAVWVATPVKFSLH